MIRLNKHEYFLQIAQVVAMRATCPRRNVGCVIINRHNHIISTGYNGVPKNYPHCLDTPCGGEDAPSGESLNCCMATHAEQNALLQCKDINSIKTIYTTLSPCITCAKLIANTTCDLVVYIDEYKDTSGLDMLKKLNIRYASVRI